MERLRGEAPRRTQPEPPLAATLRGGVSNHAIARMLLIRGKQVTVDAKREQQLRENWALDNTAIRRLVRWATDGTMHDFDQWPEAIEAAKQPEPPGRDRALEKEVAEGGQLLDQRFEFGGRLTGVSPLDARREDRRTNRPGEMLEISPPPRIVPAGPEFAGIPVETGAARDVNALQLLLQSPVYQRLVTHLVHTGGVRLAYDQGASREARWDPKARTIWLKPGGSMAERAGRIAFELANALMNPSFEALLNAVRTGQVTDPEEYATLCEKIEYESAKIRHAGSKQQMATPWPKEVDPTGRHFETDASFRADWDGKWTTFEGYLDTQKQTRHWHGYVGRFDQLPQRREYLAELERQLQETLAAAQMDVEEKVT